MKRDFSEEFIPKSNWFKFDKVGDKISGTLIKRFHKPGDGNMPDQEVFTLTNVEINEQAVEGDWNVPIKSSNQYVLSRMNNAKVGQVIGFGFAREVEPKKKGMNPAKSITPYMWGMDETYTVAEEFGGTVVDDSPFK